MSSGRIEALAREIAGREAGRVEARERAHARAVRIHEKVAAGVRLFGRMVGESGAPHLDLLRIDPVEPDDKSVRAFQVRIRRGRFHALVICKDRDEVMIVGPFRKGGPEEPCHALHLKEEASPEAAIDAAIEGLLVNLIRMSFAK